MLRTSITSIVEIDWKITLFYRQWIMSYTNRIPTYDYLLVCIYDVGENCISFLSIAPYISLQSWNLIRNPYKKLNWGIKW